MRRVLPGGIDEAEFFRPLKIEMQTPGSVVAGAGVALAGAGLLRVDGVLLALGLAAMLVCGLAWGLARWNVRGLEARISGPVMVRAGEAFRLEVALTNRKHWLFSSGLRVTVGLAGDTEAVCEVPWLGGGTEARGEPRGVADRRGAVGGLDYRIESEFPLGLWKVTRTGRVVQPMKVLPRSWPPGGLLRAGVLDEATGEAAAAGREFSGVLRGLREFRAGDGAREIAWPASLRWRARGRGLLVRQWDPPGNRSRERTVLFHSHGGEGELIRPDRFERALSLAWGCLEFFQGRGIEVVWRADFEEWMPRRIRTRAELGKLGEALAAARRHGATERHELEGRVAAATEGETVIFSDMPAASWTGPWGDDERVRVIDVVDFERPVRGARRPERRLARGA